MHPTKNDLPEEVRSAVADLLNARLADLIDLQLQTKQAHWNVKGANFIGLHELFDDLEEVVEEQVDLVAERCVALGGTAYGTVTDVKKATKLSPYPEKIQTWKDHVEAVSTAFAAAGKGVRAAIGQADELGDTGTSDLFTGMSRTLDQKLWFLEAHLQGLV